MYDGVKKPALPPDPSSSALELEGDFKLVMYGSHRSERCSRAGSTPRRAVAQRAATAPTAAAAATDGEASSSGEVACQAPRYASVSHSSTRSDSTPFWLDTAARTSRLLAVAPAPSPSHAVVLSLASTLTLSLTPPSPSTLTAASRA